MALVRKVISSQHTWDAFVLQYASRALFQSTRWGEVEKKLGATIWQYGWYDKNTLVAIAQIKKVSARRGTFLHVRHGPILSIQKKSYWQEILADLKLLAKKEGAWFVRVSPQITDSSQNSILLKSLGLIAAPIHAMDAELCWVIDLAKGEDELLAAMRKTTRYEIRRAQKMGVVVKKSSDIKDLNHFFALYETTSKRHNFVGHSGVKEEFEVFADSLNAELFLASYEGDVLAAAIILFWDDEAIYHHGASISSKVPASYLIQWEAILEAKRRGKKLYNFWGIAPVDNPSHPWRGLTVFKTGFGGRQEGYIHAHDLPVSPLYLIPKTIENIRKKMKGY